MGENERKIMIKKSTEIHEDLVNGKLIILDNVAHGLSQPGHVDEIIRAIAKYVPHKGRLNDANVPQK